MPKISGGDGDRARKRKSPWVNRIVGHDEVAPDSLLANPDNFRLHPKSQQMALEGAIDEVGYIRSVTVNKRTGHLVDGHLRVIMALRRGEKKIPVEYVDLTEEEESVALATLDPLGALARTDKQKYGELMGKTNPDNESVRDVMRELAEKSGIEATFGDEVVVADSKASKTFEGMSDELDGIAALKDYAVFQSDLPLGMPSLHPDRILSIPDKWEVWGGPAFQYNDPDVFLYLWGRSDSIRGLDTTKAVIGFYVDDFRFESFWEDPAGQTAKLLNGNVLGAMMPNFSMYWNLPQIVRLFQRYKSLWIARYFQEAGIDVLPDIQLSPDDKEYCWMGIPQGAPFATQFHTVDVKSESSGKTTTESKAEFLGEAIAALDPERVLVYANDDSWEFLEQMPYAERLVWCRSRARKFGKAGTIRRLGKETTIDTEQTE